MPGMHVRTITADDGPVLRQVRLRALADSPWAFGETLAEAQKRPAEEYEELARRCAGAGDQAGWFAEDGGRPAGMVRAYADGDAVELVAMWVAPEARGRGAGRLLVDAVVDWARRRGARAVYLQHAEGNDAARRLYARCGFVDTGEQSTMRSDPGRCRHHMRLDIA